MIVAKTTVEAAPAKTVTETAASSVEPAAAAEIAANTDLYGHYMYGRCTVPSVGMSVALYMPGSFSAIYNSQSVVDTADAAAILSYSWSGDTICSMDTEEWMVADHKNQAFSLLKNVSVGDSMYIDTGDAVTEYVCVDIQDGINNRGSEYWSDKSTGLYTMDGTRCSSLNQGGMVFYTCQENYLHVKLYFWQPV
ncbi:MAG: hypothetical protein LUE87_09775 [Lachnospiraceae bacterium]|nr:hypothetical protein [Lachnospiraceae bacterium]